MEKHIRSFNKKNDYKNKFDNTLVYIADRECPAELGIAYCFDYLLPFKCPFWCKKECWKSYIERGFV